MPEKTITVTNGDGSTKTITIPDRSRFAGVRTMSTNALDYDEITVSNAASDVNGTWVLSGTSDGRPRWHHPTNSSTYIWRLNVSSGSKWYIQDNDNDPKMVQSDNTVYDYPWDVPSWESFAGGVNYPNVEFSNQFKTLTVDRTAQVVTSDRKGESRPLLSKVVGGASAAYSLRDLNDKAGNNKVVRVRRSSDNAEKDFTASEMGAALEDWVGALNDGFVETWYDQSGNGNDATQTVAASQPKIVDAGVLVSGGIDFDGVNDTLDLPAVISSINSASSFTVARTTNASATQSALALSRNDPQLARFYTPMAVSGNFYFGYGANRAAINLGSSDTDEHLFTGIAGSSTAEGFIDGTSGGTVSSVDLYSQQASGGIGSINSTTHWNGTISEIIIYNSDQSANRAAIEANINNQYDIY